MVGTPRGLVWRACRATSTVRSSKGSCELRGSKRFAGGCSDWIRRRIGSVGGRGDAWLGRKRRRGDGDGRMGVKGCGEFWGRRGKEIACRVARRCRSGAAAQALALIEQPPGQQRGRVLFDPFVEQGADLFSDQRRVIQA